MNYTSISELAAEVGVSYEAVRRNVVRYKKELEGHITTVDKKQLLDEYAVDFIKGKRRESPVVVKVESASEAVEAYKQEVEDLKRRLIGIQERILELEHENRNLIESRIRCEYLTTQHQEDMERIRGLYEQQDADRDQLRQLNSQVAVDQVQIEALRAEKDKAQAAADQARQEVNQFQRTIFGFYRKRG